MKCDKCGTDMEHGEGQERYSQMLCEDCYLDALSPAQGCNPWAVYLAKSSAEKGGDQALLTDPQMKILEVLSESGGLEPGVLAERIEIKISDLEREIATLRHMEKVRGALKKGKKVIRLW